MRVPLSWLRDYVDLPAGETGRQVAERLVAVGLEVERVEEVGADVTGPLVVGRVADFADETHKNGKTIRWCQVDVGESAPRGVVCGARNFAVGDLVVVALPGAMLPGGFAIVARKTYGHVSDGMICSARELGLGDDHSGILVLEPGLTVGADAFAALGLRDDVLDIAVTPDRGYCLSIRGVAREAATAYGVPLRDPAEVPVPGRGADAAASAGYPVRIDDPAGCDRFVTRTVTGLDTAAPSPLWLQRRLLLAGMRPISLAVDITNAVMLDLGQPLHAYDRDRLAGPIVVRRARPAERLVTLDGATRDLDPDDLLITDDSGPIGIAGVMGGATTEITPQTRAVVIEAAHFEPLSIARASRRHRLSSEASRRFERGVDPALPAAAAEAAVRLLVTLGGATAEPGGSDVDSRAERTPIPLPLDLPERLGGRRYDVDTVVRRLRDVGCRVDLDGSAATVTPPSWRPDLAQGADLVEEILRLEGYATIPSVLPVARGGRGHTREQRLRRRVGLALAGAGYVEVQSYPFVGPAAWDQLGLPADDQRRRTLRLANPLSEEEPDLRTSLLPGLLRAAQRNVGRGTSDLALFETGLVFLPRDGAADGAAAGTGAGDAAGRPPQVSVERRPADEEIARLEALLPRQPRHAAVVLSGAWRPAGWWGAGAAVSWADAVEAARTVARAVGLDLAAARAEPPPWHPGRCAALVLPDGTTAGHAGELHPAVVESLGLPARTCAAEIDLDAVLAAAPEVVPAPRFSTYPVAKEDVALVVPEAVAAAEVQAALHRGAGPLLESLRLFDVYAGPQVPAGHKSLAFALRFRAPDRTLTVEEVSAARDAAVAEAARRTGAALRGT